MKQNKEEVKNVAELNDDDLDGVSGGAFDYRTDSDTFKKGSPVTSGNPGEAWQKQQGGVVQTPSYDLPVIKPGQGTVKR